MILTKKICLSTILFFVAYNSVAQDIKIKWCPPLEYDNHYIPAAFYGNTQTKYFGFFVNSSANGKAYIIGLNKDLNQRFQKEVSVPVPPDVNANTKFDLRKILYLNNRAYVFVSYLNVREKKRLLYFFKINDDGVLDEKLTLVSQVEEKLTFAVDNSYAGFNIIISEDSSKIAVCSRKVSSPNENVAYDVLVFDNNIRKLWEKNIQLNYTNKTVTMGELAVDNDGNIGIYGYVGTNSKGIPLGKELTYKAFAYICSGHTGDVKEYPLDIKGDLIVDGMSFVFDNAHKMLIVTGLCSVPYHPAMLIGRAAIEQDARKNKTGFDSYYGGYFYAAIDENTQKILKQNVAPIQADILNRFKNNWHPNLFTGTTTLYLMPNNSLVYVTESNTSSIRSVSGPILLFSINTDGNMQWMSLINKDQNESNSYFDMSHLAIKDGNSLHFIYNDNPININMPISSEIKMYSDPLKAMVIDAVVDEKGEIKKYDISTKDEDGNSIFIDPYFSYQINCKTIVSFGGIYYKKVSDHATNTTYSIGFINAPNAVK